MSKWALTLIPLLLVVSVCLCVCPCLQRVAEEQQERARVRVFRVAAMAKKRKRDRGAALAMDGVAAAADIPASPPDPSTCEGQLSVLFLFSCLARVLVLNSVPA